MMQTIRTIGLDTAESVFQVHALMLGAGWSFGVD